jgi:hypothetical protein
VPQRALFFLFVVGIASIAYGQTSPFSIVPAQPQYQGTVNLRVDQQSAFYIGGQVSMAGNTITVALETSGFTLPPGGGPIEVPLGQFPTGNYNVDIVQQGSTTPLSALHFQVLAPSASTGTPQVVIVPSSPKFGEPVHVTMPTGTVGNFMPSSTTVTMSGNTITVTVSTISFESSPGLQFLDVVAGRFPAGSYDVKVITAGDLSGQLGTAHFVVADRDTAITAPIYDYSDMWWTPGESGWGLSLTQHASTNLFAAWFVYGSDGHPIWYVLPSGIWSMNVGLGTLNTYSGQVYRTSGPYYGGQFLPANVVVTPVGTAQLTFSDYSHGTFTYTIEGVSGSKAIERQPF